MGGLSLRHRPPQTPTLTQPHEGAHEVHLDRAGAAEDRSGHDGAVLSERVGRESRIAMLLVTTASGERAGTALNLKVRTLTDPPHASA
jgi:hypothetical protein